MRKVIEAVQSKEVYDLETCVKKNLEKMFYRIPNFKVSELSDRYTISISPLDNSDMKILGSASIIKKWIKDSGIRYSNLKCGKMQHPRLGNEMWCEVYK